MDKTMRMIGIEDFRKLAEDFNEGYLAVYDPQLTILILDIDKNHVGSIYLPEIMEVFCDKEPGARS